MKEDYLKNIKELFDNIVKLPFAQYGGRPYDLAHYTTLLIEQIDHLTKVDDCKNCPVIIGALNRTLGKEVYLVQYAYEKTLEENASKIRTVEYYEAFESAIRQIKIDIYSLLIKVE